MTRPLEDMTAEEAATELACEEIRQKWAEDEYRRESIYLKDQQERELKMQMLRSRAKSKSFIDLSFDSNDENDVKVKTEAQADRTFEPGSAYQETSSRKRAVEMPTLSHTSTRLVPQFGRLMDTPAERASSEKNSRAGSSNELKKGNYRFADFSAPYPEHLPTIIDDPNGVSGQDYIELRCGKCGANFGRSQTFIRGPWGFHSHIRSIHSKAFPKGRFPEIVEICAYRALPRQEVESLRRGQVKIDIVPSPGAEADHPLKRKRNGEWKQGESTNVKSSRNGRRSAQDKVQKNQGKKQRSQHSMRRKQRSIDSSSEDSESDNTQQEEHSKLLQPPEQTDQNIFQNEFLPFSAAQNKKNVEDASAEVAGMGREDSTDILFKDPADA
ncbi:hypothetical protein CERZMDRAFT_102142 [Cercospora zeae-maydis SCOH1-5]|uniref:Uncharacterized protein n=1 Tax=Cercospora zeae-maydis SCOH1-5 TaxID=717836 RepID=A0A6A6F127_9PEZI|nr:hypothetical protein CERZMDRAFT_102142 [Cercospora zeae-maydis SCOH1-5]